jgi:hypothetical protein
MAAPFLCLFEMILGKSPNVRAHLLPEAGATQERTLEAVRCSALLGGYSQPAAIRDELATCCVDRLKKLAE